MGLKYAFRKVKIGVAGAASLALSACAGLPPAPDLQIQYSHNFQQNTPNTETFCDYYAAALFLAKTADAMRTYGDMSSATLAQTVINNQLSDTEKSRLFDLTIVRVTSGSATEKSRIIENAACPETLETGLSEAYALFNLFEAVVPTSYSDADFQRTFMAVRQEAADHLEQFKHEGPSGKPKPLIP